MALPPGAIGSAVNGTQLSMPISSCKARFFPFVVPRVSNRSWRTALRTPSRLNSELDSEFLSYSGSILLLTPRRFALICPDRFQGTPVGDCEGRTLHRDQVLAPEIAQCSSNSLPRRSDKLGNFLMSERQRDWRTLFRVLHDGRPIKKQPRQFLRSGR